MATISPVTTINGDVPVVSWTGITTTTDTAAAYGPMNRRRGAERASVTFAGTFAGGTQVSLLGSNDGVNFGVLTDIAGNAISGITAAAIREFSTSCLYIKPEVTGGAADNVNVAVLIRGSDD